MRAQQGRASAAALLGHFRPLLPLVHAMPVRLSCSPAPPAPPARWRKLEGSDPTTYEMVLKIQALQRRLIAKTEEVVEKDLLIQVGGGYCGWYCRCVQ